jgi:SAM-dependent methyltransferase
LNYDRQAARYDSTRGGPARAAAAAEAIEKLLPADAWLVLDVAGGTGIVGQHLAGRTVCSVDRSAGMSALAATRLPGRVALGDARCLPIADASVDAVTLVWLLHLLDKADSAAVVAEAARVLRPGGTLVTTVDKTRAQLATGDDVGRLLLPAWEASGFPVTDGVDRVTRLGAEHGLVWQAGTTFIGVGQGNSPRGWQSAATNAWHWIGDVVPDLAALPDQDRRRGDPVYRVAALVRQ